MQRYLKKKGLRIDSLCQRCGSCEETIAHMLFHCAVAAEIWELSPIEHILVTSDSIGNLLAYIWKLLEHNLKAGDLVVRKIPLFLFIGWRIWKMRNNFVFNGKRKLIPHIISKALCDHKEWIDSQQKMEENQIIQNLQRRTVSKPKTKEEVFQLPHFLFCFVDGSWSAETERAGIGWQLYDNIGACVMTGSSSVNPIASAQEVEAYALRNTVYQIKRHGYKGVAFLYYSETLCTTLTKCLNEIVMGRNLQISTYYDDVERLVHGETDSDFKFYVVPRKVVKEADVLVKGARLSKSNYVIKWC